MDTILKKHKTANPWLSRDKLNNFKRSIARKKTNRMEKKADSVSTLTATSGYDETNDNAVSFEDEDDALAPIFVDVDTNATALTVVDVDANAPAPIVVDINRGGRPKGSTNESIREHIRKKKLALNFAASEASRMKSEYRSLGFECVPKGVYKEIKKRAEDRFS
jgi:hypothetical protein